MFSTIAQAIKRRYCILSHGNEIQSMIRNFPSRGISVFSPSGFSIPDGGAARLHHSPPQIPSRGVAAAGTCRAFRNSRKKAKKFGPWDQEDEEVEDDGCIYGAFNTIQEFRYHCRKKCVIQLCEHRGPIPAMGYQEGAMGYEDSEVLARMDSGPGPSFHDLVRDVIDRYNFEQKENLELIKILHLNYLGLFGFMKIEARDNKNGDIRAYQLAIWNKHCNGSPEVGRFKEVTLQTCVN